MENLKIIDLSDKKQVVYYGHGNISKLSGVLIEPNENYIVGSETDGNRYNTLPIVGDEWKVIENAPKFTVVGHEGMEIPCNASFIQELIESKSEHCHNEDIILDIFRKIEKLGMKVKDVTSNGAKISDKILLKLTAFYIPEQDEPTIKIENVGEFQFYIPELYVKKHWDLYSYTLECLMMLIEQYGVWFDREDLTVKILGLKKGEVPDDFLNLERDINEVIKSDLQHK